MEKGKKKPEEEVIIACICKNEKPYIKEFIDYHLGIGFDKIIIGDNNGRDSEEDYTEILSEYIEKGTVRVINLRGKIAIQKAFYNYVIDKVKYKWCAFIDCDEFITFSNESGIHTIRELLDRDDKVEGYKLNWLVMGDSGKATRDVSGYVTEDFTKNAPIDVCYTYKFPENCHCKSILRKSVKAHFEGNPHTVSGFYNYVTPSLIMSDGTPFQKMDYHVAFIRHYYTKSLEEWIKYKMGRGYADILTNKEDTYKLDRYFAYNEKTPAHDSVLSKYNLSYEGKKE